MTVEVSSEKSRISRIVIIVVAGVVGTALMVGGLWLAFRPAPPRPKQSAIEPAAQTEPATLPPVPAATATPSAASTGVPGAGPDAVTTSAPVPAKPEPVAPGRVGKVAFGLGASIYVANEDGTGSKAVVRSNSGPYALSPNGKKLALVSLAGLSVVDVASGKQTFVAPAELVAPVWMPDSSRVMWVRQAPMTPVTPGIWAVDASGANPELVVASSDRVAVSPDGRIVVARPWSGGSAPSTTYGVFVSRGGGPFKLVKAPGLPTALAASNTRLFLGSSNPKLAAGNRISVVSMTPAGKDQKKLRGAPAGDVPAVWNELAVSPDGVSLAAGALGDDEYSRVWVIPHNGGEGVLLTPRRDGYIHGWSASGDSLFLIDGNAYQGESTALLSVKPDGGGRRLIVTGVR